MVKNSNQKEPLSWEELKAQFFEVQRKLEATIKKAESIIRKEEAKR